MTPELVAGLAEHKAEVLALLAGLPAPEAGRPGGWGPAARSIRRIRTIRKIRPARLILRIVRILRVTRLPSRKGRSARRRPRLAPRQTGAVQRRRVWRPCRSCATTVRRPRSAAACG